jgi:hypothetical protein
MGLGSGVELIPYFLALLGFLAAAVLAVVQWPLFVLARWRRKGNAQRAESPPNAPPPAGGSPPAEPL